MAKEKKVEQVPKVGAEEQGLAPSGEEAGAQAQVFTPEQQTQIEALIAEAEEKGYGKSQEEIERKEKVIKRLQGERSQKVTTRETTIPSDDSLLLQTIIADMKAKEVEDGEVNPRRVILEQELVNRQQRTETARFEAFKQGKIAEEESGIKQQIIDAGDDPDDEKFDRTWDAFKLAKVDGDFSDAHTRVDRILKEVKPEEKKEKGELTDEEKEEIARSYLEKTGKLKSDTGGPSASGKPPITRAWLKTATVEEYKERQQEIDDAYREGRIK